MAFRLVDIGSAPSSSSNNQPTAAIMANNISSTGSSNSIPQSSLSSSYSSYSDTDTSLMDTFSWLIRPQNSDVTQKPSTINPEVKQYLTYAMIGLICHITIVNLCAVMTLTYGIVRHSTSWAIRLICEHRRIRTLSPKANLPIASASGVTAAAAVAGASRIDNRRGAVVSQRVNDNNIHNSSVRMDCTTYPYLLSLALSDLFIGIAIAPLQLDLFVNNGKWQYGYFWCDLWRALDIFFCTSSAMHTAAIAVDRWWSITCENTINYYKPNDDSVVILLCAAFESQLALYNNSLFFTLYLKGKPSTIAPKVRLQRTLLTFLWILSAMVSVPVMYLWQIESPERISVNNQTCEPVGDNTYLLLSTMVSFFLPLMLTIAFYVQIALLIRNRWTLLKRRTVIEFSSILTSMMLLGAGGPRPHPRNLTRTLHHSSSSIAAGHSGGFFEDSAPAISKAISSSAALHDDNKISNIARTMNYLKHIRNLIRAMSIVVLMYVICWFPLYAILLIKAACKCIDNSDWERLVSGFTWLGYANSGINPIIYFVTLEEYRVLSISLFRLIGERIAMMPKVVFRTFWWLSDKRLRSIVKLTEFFVSTEPASTIKAMPLKVVSIDEKKNVSNNGLDTNNGVIDSTTNTTTNNKPRRQSTGSTNNNNAVRNSSSMVFLSPNDHRHSNTNRQSDEIAVSSNNSNCSNMSNSSSKLTFSVAPSPSVVSSSVGAASSSLNDGARLSPCPSSSVGNNNNNNNNNDGEVGSALTPISSVSMMPADQHQAQRQQLLQRHQQQQQQEEDIYEEIVHHHHHHPAPSSAGAITNCSSSSNNNNNNNNNCCSSPSSSSCHYTFDDSNNGGPNFNTLSSESMMTTTTRNALQMASSMSGSSLTLTTVEQLSTSNYNNNNNNNNSNNFGSEGDDEDMNPVTMASSPFLQHHHHQQQQQQQLPRYYDRFGRPINYDAVESSI